MAIEVEQSVVIHRPREELFALVAKLDNWGWLRLEPREDGETSLAGADVGTAFRSALEVKGQRVELLCEVTDYEPDERLAFACVREDAWFMVDLVFEPADGGTRLICKGEGNMRGFFNNLIEPLVAQEMNERVKAGLESMRGMLDPETSREA